MEAISRASQIVTPAPGGRQAWIRFDGFSVRALPGSEIEAEFSAEGEAVTLPQVFIRCHATL